MNGLVIWITGLSGAGKTTLGKLISERLRSEGRQVIFLDGDELRAVFLSNAYLPSKLERQGRLELAYSYARLCQLLAKQEFIVVIATISMFREVHAWNRANLPSYYEVYLKVPLEELRRRDPKGIYQRFDSGELKNVAGLDLPIDEPEESDLIVDYAVNQTELDIVNDIINNLPWDKY